MMTFEERKTDLKLVSKGKNQTMSAPWCLTAQGEPWQIQVPAGAKACCDLRNNIMHVHDSKRGMSHTLTPSVRVRLDHEQDFHDIDFIDLEDPTLTLASVYINEGVLKFDDRNRATFSNTQMLQCVSKLLASPAFNPWTVLPKIRNEVSFYQCDLATGEVWLNPELDDVKNVDKAYSDIISLSFETSEPVPCWNHDARQDDVLPPGIYHAEVIKSNHDTGEIEKVMAEGWTSDESEYCTFHIPFEPLFRLLEDGKLPTANVVYRVQFDPRVHTDMALNAAAKPKGMLGKLFG